MNIRYEVLASLLRYPEADYHERVRQCLAGAPEACREDLAAFAAGMLSMSVEKAQEKFTATFDLNPNCALDLGWHLFGEKYERGLLLVRMRQELQRYGVAESAELPDHLSHALLLLGRMERDAAADFAGAIVLPALAKLLPAIEAHPPFDRLLRAIDRCLRADFPELAPVEPATTLPILQEVEQ